MEDRKYKSISVKNAKKIIFYFTSRLLFMILAIIFITYGCSMFVHADDEYNITVNYIPNPEYSTLGSITNDVQLPFKNSEIADSFTELYGFVYNPMDNFQYYFTADYYENDNFSLLTSDVPIITKFNGYMNGVQYDIDYSSGDYYIIMFYPTFNSNNIKFSYYIVPKTFIYNNRYLNTVTVNYPRIDCTIYNNGDIVFSSTAEYSTSVSVQQVIFSDMPMWVTNGATISSNDVEPNVTNDFDSNYIANINIPLVNGDLEPDEGGDDGIATWDEESNSNHLALTKSDVYLTVNATSLHLLTNCDLTFDIKVDDYIAKRIDSYYLSVNYFFVYRDDGGNEIDCLYLDDMIPLRAFTNQPYQINFYELAKRMKDTDSGKDLTYMLANLEHNLHSVIETVAANAFQQLTIDTLNHLFPWTKAFNYLVPGLQIKAYDTQQPLHVQNCYFMVQYHLRTDEDYVVEDDISYNISKPFTKRFDFNNGTQQVTNYGILDNEYPWYARDPETGEIIPVNDNNNSTNYGSGSVVVGGDTNTNNIYVNGGGHKIPVNVQSEEELDDVIERYGHLQQTLSGYFQDISEETSNNNFFALLGDTMPMIPYLDFMLKCAMCIIGLGVILFVLKVLLR